ncbi:MAG: hypothetical protein HYV07_00620 [Deltaproteobacteria bacterium]|nr:hypothetical protein [Deltaproteobacteria bacterium]
MIRGPWIIVVLLLAAAEGIFAYRPIWDADIFWHVELGRYMVEHRAFLREDVFSAIDPTRPTASLQWLYEVLVAVLDGAGGLHLVRVFHVAAAVISVPVLFWVFRKHERLPAAVAVALVVVYMMTFSDRLRLRPDALTPVLWALSLVPLAKSPAELDRRDAILAFLLTFVWSCVHAGVGGLIYPVAALAVPAGALFGGLRSLRPAAIWYSGVLAGAALAPEAVLGNVRHLLRFESSGSTAPEWAPTWSVLIDPTHPTQVLNAAFAGFVLLGAVASAFGLARKRMKARAIDPGAAARLLFAVALLMLALGAYRFVSLAVFAAAALCVDAPRRFARLSMRRLVAGLAVLVFALTAHANTLHVYGSLRDLAIRLGERDPVIRRKFPVAHADFLERTGFEGRVFAQPDWGAYLLYRLYPRVRVISDGRASHSPEVTADLLVTSSSETFALPESGPALERIYSKYPVEAIVHQHLVWPDGYRPSSRFVRVFSDRFGAVWIRADTAGGRAYLERLGGLRD